MKDFSDYKFRSSQVYNILVGGRGGELIGKTTQSYLLKIWIKETFNREKEIESKYLDKGIWVEEDSITLTSKVLGKFLEKNETQLANDYLTGTPDVIVSDEGYVLDIKSSWDIYTFFEADGSNKQYQTQLLSYMALTGLKKARLAYCLVDTPEFIRKSLLSKGAFQSGFYDGTKEYLDLEQEIDRTYTYGDIDPLTRVKFFDFEFSQKDLDNLYKKIEASRLYLNQLNTIYNDKLPKEAK